MCDKYPLQRSYGSYPTKSKGTTFSSLLSISY